MGPREPDRGAVDGYENDGLDAWDESDDVVDSEMGGDQCLG